MNLATYQAFSSELLKQAGLGTAAARHGAKAGKYIEEAVVGTAKILRDSSHPKYLKKGLGDGLHAMGNMNKHKLESMKQLQGGDRGVAGQIADVFRNKGGILAADQRQRAIGKAYKADYHKGTGLVDKLRRHGVLSGAAKYEGPSKVRKGLNVVRRALPGEVSVNVGLGGHAAYQGLKTDRDPATGRPIGMGERVGRAGLGFTTGIVGMRGGITTGIGSAVLGDQIGKHVGRGFDRATGAVRGRPFGVKANEAQQMAPYQTATGAAPAPTGVG